MYEVYKVTYFEVVEAAKVEGLSSFHTLQESGGIVRNN